MKDATLVVLVLDRSGSIADCLKPMQSALDEFIETQKKEPGECELALFQFDDVYEPVFRKPIKDAPKHQIVPRNMTALHDAIGKTINDIGDSLAKQADNERPDKVMFAIITDGYENSSKEFDAKKIAGMVKHQQEKYQWDFVFLGANQDAVLTAQTFNIPAAKSMSFVATASGIAATSSSLNSYTRSLRASCSASQRKSMGFTPEERRKAMKK